MATIPIQLTYRPPRVGFCIKDQDFESLRKIMRIGHCLWGGVFNPFIVVDDRNKAKLLIESFRIDLLIAASEDEIIKEFIDDFPHLKPSYLRDDISFDGVASVLDIRHPIAKFLEDKNGEKPVRNFIVPKWSDTEPLADLLIANVGQYPLESPFKLDFGKKIVEDRVGEQLPELTAGATFPFGLLEGLNPSKMSRALLERSNSGSDEIGVFLGSKENFGDFVDHWNLRASGKNLLFVDLNHEARFQEWIQFQAKKVEDRLKRRKENPRNYFYVVSGSNELIEAFKRNHQTVKMLISHLSIDSWHHDNLRPAFHRIKRDSALATVSDKYGKPSLVFELRERPYRDGVGFFHQSLVIELNPLFYRDSKKEFSFDSIYCPELNLFYTREMRGGYSSQVRSNPNGFSIIIDCSDKHLDVGAIKIEAMICELFKVYGMNLTSSKPGLIARQICNQLDGLQGCRVFKIEGVRTLINSFKSDTWFDDQAAIHRIGNFDPETNRPRFDAYKQLWVDYRDGREEQRPKDVLRYLLRTKILRNGIEVVCSKCNLKFWKSINEIGEFVSCLYCDNREDITPTAFEKKWQFRKSGLFEGDDNQEGAIPVLVSMQQLDTWAGMQKNFFLFASKIKGLGIDCESDFILVSKESHSGTPQVLISECKNRGKIERKDLENLTGVANKFPRDKVQTFIFLAKFAEFLPEEISMIKEFVDNERANIIMWSARELEPYMPYEISGKMFDIGNLDMSLEGLARATHAIYLNPRPVKEPIENEEEN